MGIRFTRTSRATNGPLIFFSDPSADVSLCEEIRGAIDAQLSFYAYRRPGDIMVSFGSSEGYVKGIGTPGFAIAPFDPTQDPITIPYKPRADMIKAAATSAVIPSKSTTLEEYTAEIEEIQQQLRENGGGKIVAARVIAANGTVDVAATFAALCRQYPSAFVFAFSTPLTGCWIGASPELLLSSFSGKLQTMALAGSRPTGTPGGWDDKNREEQAMVVDYICDCMTRNGLPPSRKETVTAKAGGVEHICTPIMAGVPADFNPTRLTALLKDLSPTPALCGLPKELALEVIKSTESFPRGCYGGWCGPYLSPFDFHFQVILRCAQVGAERYALYAGGGITLKSNPGAEWAETELKAQTLLSTIIFDN